LGIASCSLETLRPGAPDDLTCINNRAMTPSAVRRAQSSTAAIRVQRIPARWILSDEALSRYCKRMRHAIDSDQHAATRAAQTADIRPENVMAKTTGKKSTAGARRNAPPNAAHMVMHTLTL